MSALLLLLFVGLVAAQPHHGTGPQCYECGGPGPEHEYPGCLKHTRHCHQDEVCQIKYGGPKTEIRCHRKHDCDREVRDATRQCAQGGSLVHETCQICCSNDTCTSTAVNNLGVASSADTNHLAVHCPADCTLTNLASCVSSGHVCNNNQFCKVTMDESNGHIHGRCQEKGQVQHCRDEAADGKCDPAHHNCVVGCCTDDQCVAGTLGSTTTSFWQFLQGSCVDQLEGNQCASLDASKHLCNDRLALRVCPQTCRLCSVYNASTCKDTVAGNGCPELVTSEDICNNDIAIHICPVTCNMCDKLLDQKINEALHNANPAIQMTAPAPATTTSAASGVLGGLSSITCATLASQNCGVLDAVCPVVNCPTECSKCQKPIVTVVSTSGPVVVSAVPASTVAPAQPIGNMANVVTAGSVGPATTEVCADTITQMSCADVEDVCSSPLLVSYCKKYCGLC